MTPLCYLWQRAQDELLPEMVKAGMHAVLIKVAGIGLKKAHLGKSLAEMKDHLFEMEFDAPAFEQPMGAPRRVLVVVRTSSQLVQL